MRDCSENACAEGALECGSASYRRSLVFQGGSFALLLTRIFCVLDIGRLRSHIMAGPEGAFRE